MKVVAFIALGLLPRGRMVILNSKTEMATMPFMVPLPSF